MRERGLRRHEPRSGAHALYTPLATSFLAGGGFLKMGLLAQVMGYSTAFLAYQAPPILFGPTSPASGAPPSHATASSRRGSGSFWSFPPMRHGGG